MSESKHTPGPWLREGGVIYTLVHARWRKGAGQFKNWFWATVQGCGKISVEELEANRCLIAAAPDMYSALKDLMKFPATIEERTACAQRALSAIAKAEDRDVVQVVK